MRFVLSLAVAFCLAVQAAPAPIGFYPGAFDPPTKAHFAVVADAIRIKGLEKVYLFLGPYGDKDFNLSSQERAALFQKVFDSHPETAGKVTVSVDYLVPKALNDITEANPDRPIYMLAGADRADPKRMAGLPPNVRFLVFPRAGSEMPDLSALKHVEVVDVGLLSSATQQEISSTKVREAAAAGLPVGQWVDPIVEHEIVSRNLFKPVPELERAKLAWEKEARTFFEEFGLLKGWNLSDLPLPPFKATQTRDGRREKLVRWVIEQRQITGDERAVLFEEAKPVFERARRLAGICDWAALLHR